MIGYVIFDYYDFSRYHLNVPLRSRGLPFLREAMNVNTFSALIWNLTCNSIVNEGLGDVLCASECFHFFVLRKTCQCKVVLCTTRKFLCICMYFCVYCHVFRVGVCGTIGGVWISEWNYWPLVYTTWNCALQITDPYRLVSSIYYSPD